MTAVTAARCAVSVGLVLVTSAARAHAKGCTEHSFVVGFEHCSHFGEWSRDDDYVPRLWIELAGFDHHYASAPFSLGDANVAASEPSRLSTHANGFALRVLGGLGRTAYTGVELDGGAVHLDSVVMGLDPADSSYTAVHAIAGVHTAIAVFGLAAELAAGFRYEEFDSCIDKGCNDITASQFGFELEARVRVHAFIRPHWSISLAIGQSLVDSGDHQIVIATAIHLRAMDGM